MKQGLFPEDFVWGVATSSYQVEGSLGADGRGESIWDTFSRMPGKVKYGHNGEPGAYQYRRYEEDVKLMAELGITSYRFSIAWPRVFPYSMKERNPKGFDYYDRLIDGLLAHGIEPFVTLYHWDLPQYLEDEGGWPSRETAFYFADYARACFDALGDRVKMWATLNEPLCSSVLGYALGWHAPGKEDWNLAMSALHHLYLGHGLAVRAFRDGGYEGRIGMVQVVSVGRPATRREEDLLALEKYREESAKLFLDPLYGRGYPERLVREAGDSFPLQEGDLDIIATPMDFLGLNYYSERAIKADPENPRGFSEAPDHYPKTAMGWAIVPQGLYRLFRWVYDHYTPSEMYVSENGAAFQDVLTPDEDACHDPERIAYLRDHLASAARIVKEGIPLKGYYLWSFIDNFEWAYGYTKRFGIVYCDYLDGRRIPKDSYYYYREVIAGNEVFEV
ncbi:GH1 family beta-glucosidase [Spirochaeta thermophila]|uniref:Beta-glucosidase n=1 Tax=Winmispira thermophila (strain ATCC 49972 / DSM 6192 / RI 19.B1) TaxID=665571 RepID=E0RQX8_WINT6|nr:GH1 family beta-glucosidase [Spirochaeta thermophila]ADN03034.1 beta-glucosidase A [Spirochaeta thermophila DSM 6192]